LLRLAELRDSLRSAGNADRAGRFSCDGCVAWCCRSGNNSMRATPLEALAVARLLQDRGEEAVRQATVRLRASIDAGELEVEPADEARAPDAGTYTCPFLTPANTCGVHGAKPLGCVTFTPVVDGGCDQDLPLLETALEECASLNDEVAGGAWRDLPFPVAVLHSLAPRGGTPR
jgi:Fe-S-cluster containining protein